MSCRPTALRGSDVDTLSEGRYKCHGNGILCGDLRTVQSWFDHIPSISYCFSLEPLVYGEVLDTVNEGRMVVLVQVGCI